MRRAIGSKRSHPVSPAAANAPARPWACAALRYAGTCMQGLGSVMLIVVANGVRLVASAVRCDGDEHHAQGKGPAVTDRPKHHELQVCEIFPGCRHTRTG